MSLVRYVNKKTGWVSVYESTSYYDPVKKQARPKRTYLGYEDPKTGEFVPSSGQRGRKKKAASDTVASTEATTQESYHAQYLKALSEIDRLKEENKQLSGQVKSITVKLKKYQTIADTVIAQLNQLSSTD